MVHQLVFVEAPVARPRLRDEGVLDPDGPAKLRGRRAPPGLFHRPAPLPSCAVDLDREVGCSYAGGQFEKTIAEHCLRREEVEHSFALAQSYDYRSSSLNRLL